MFTKVPSIFALSVGLSAVGASFANAAVNTANYPGAICQPAASNASLIVRGTDGSLSNFNFTTQTVICPAVRDNATTGGIEEVRLYGAGATMTCTLYSRNGTGGGALPPNQDSQTVVINGSIKTYQFLQETSPPGQPKKLNTTPQGIVYIGCSMPFGAQIFGYSVDEL